MTEGSPPTNFSSTFQSADGKEKKLCERDACGFCYGSLSVFFSFYKVYHKLFYVFETSAQKKKRFYVLISFLFIFMTLMTGSLPDRYALPPPRSDFLSLGTNLQPAPNLRHLSFSPVPSMMIGSEQCLHGWVQPPSN